MENKNPQARTVETATVDQGLRSYMIKVYNYIAGGLCVTTLFAYLATNTPLAHLFFRIENGNLIGFTIFGLIMAFAPLFMGVIFGKVMSGGTIKQTQIGFWSFSAVLGISLSSILLVYTHESLVRVFLTTAAMFGAMSLYGYTTKKDLTSWRTFLTMALIGFFITIVINIFVQSSGLSLALGFIGVILFTGLIAYETQEIRNMYNPSEPEEISSRRAIFGAFHLYIAFINLFLSLLRLLGDRR